MSDVDYVIDALGEKEFSRELSVLKKGGILLSLRTGPNKAFAEKNKFFFAKRTLFALAGSKYDKQARRQGKEYRFIFVRADGTQLEKITRIVEAEQLGICIGQKKIFSKDCTADGSVLEWLQLNM